MAGGGVNVSRRQAEIGMLHGKCLMAPKVVDLAAEDPVAGWVYVGKGNIVRVRFTAVTGFAYIGFAKEEASSAAPTAVTDQTIEVDMDVPDTYYVAVASEDYIRVSSALSRLEVIQA